MTARSRRHSSPVLVNGPVSVCVCVCVCVNNLLVMLACAVSAGLTADVVDVTAGLDDTLLLAAAAAAGLPG